MNPTLKLLYKQKEALEQSLPNDMRAWTEQDDHTLAMIYRIDNWINRTIEKERAKHVNKTVQ
jgi:hypothetical protein